MKLFADKKKWNSIKLFLFILPFLILVFIFSYYPLYGWVYAFYDYRPPRPFSDAEFVGLKWFKSLVENDIKINQLLQVLKNTFAMSAITALTAQNTTGVTGILEVSPEFLGQQLDAVFTDIRPDAVKIGMVSSSPLIEKIAERLRFYQAENIVLDPVMAATSGSRLIAEEAVETLKKELIPLASLVTPNIPEAEILADMEIRNKTEMEAAAERIGSAYRCAVLVKGGHDINDADDFLYADGKTRWFQGKRIANPNTHGTGCTLSSAIAANLAKGFPMEEAVERAKAYISGALAAMLDLGKGRGPMNHAFYLQGEFAREAGGDA